MRLLSRLYQELLRVLERVLCGLGTVLFTRIMSLSVSGLGFRFGVCMGHVMSTFKAV